MPRTILEEARLHPAIRERVATLNADIVHNVQAAASSNAVLVVGMAGNPVVRAIYAPGLWLQALTTRPPDHSMLEVSIASLESCLASDRAAAPPTNR